MAVLHDARWHRGILRPPTIVLSAALWGLAHSAAGQGLSARLERLTVATGTVDFREISHRTADSQVILEEWSEDRFFRVGLSHDHVSLGADRRNLRHYDLFAQSANGGSVTRLKIRGTCSGVVGDGWHEVVARISQGKIGDIARLNIPVGCGGSMPAGVSIEEPGRLNSVPLGGDSRLDVRLRNTSDIELEVDVPSELMADSELWQHPPRAVQGNHAVRIKPGDVATIQFLFSPAFFSASKAAFLQVREVDEHAIVPVRFEYRNPFIGNRDGYLEEKLRIRFQPHPAILFGALLSGVVLGALVRLLAPRGRGTGGMWLRGTGTALVVAVCAQLLALFMVQFGSKFVFFTLELNPWQTLPALIIGLVFGLLGSESVSALGRLLKLEGKAVEQPVSREL